MSKDNNCEWSDCKKWWMDLLKSVVTFAIVVIIGVVWMDRHNSKLELERHKDKTKIDAAIKIANECEKTAVAYYACAYDAYIDKKKLGQRLTSYSKTPNISRFEDKDNDDFMLALKHVRGEFGEDKKIHELIESIIKSSAAMHEAYKLTTHDRFETERKNGKNLAELLIQELNSQIENRWRVCLK